MKREEFIRRYGEAAYEKQLQQVREWNATHPGEKKVSAHKWVERNPEKLRANHREQHRKGGKHYEKHKQSHKEGLSGDKERVRVKHQRKWAPYKKLIAPDSQIHHQWLPGTAEYTGMALVEKDPHQHGFVDVIQILEGEITLLTEEEIRAK